MQLLGNDHQALYTAAQTRELDRCAIEQAGIPGITLMGRAAAAAMDQLLVRWPRPELIQVLAGTGNNAGDGYLLADRAHKRGLAAVVLQLGDPTRMGGDAQAARAQALANGVTVRAWAPNCLQPLGVIVDAMLGTGLGGPVRANYRQAIEQLNTLGQPVLAVDVPSGLDADTGGVLGAAVRAQVTVTFIARKRGLYTLDGPDLAGVVEFAGLEVPAEVYQRVPAACWRLQLHSLLAQLQPRPANVHKGRYGSVLVVGGDAGMAGAAALAAEASLRCGAGLVRIATRAQHVPPIIARIPEAMVHAVTSARDLEPLLALGGVRVIGPGLGRSNWSEQLLQSAVSGNGPLVLDADALNLLATGRLGASQPRAGWVLTPHPGEAARLLDCTIRDIQRDRFAAARALQQRYGGVVVLKGNGTLIATTDGLWLSDYGNPGMASGGMGDVLSGVIGALLAQGLDLAPAAALGVCLHGAAADIAVREGQRGLLATDLLAPLRALLG